MTRTGADASRGRRRRRRSRSRSTSTAPAARGRDDRAAVLRPHARPARPPRRVRPDGRRPTATSTSTATTPSRTPASSSARPSPRRWATRPACAASRRVSSRSTRRSSRSPSTCRAGRSSCGTSPSARCCPSATRRSTREMAGHFWQQLRHRRRHHPARPQAGRRQHPPRRRGHLQGRRPLPRATRCASRAREVPSHQGHAVSADPSATDRSSPCSTTASATCARPRRRSSGSAPTPGSPPTRPDRRRRRRRAARRRRLRAVHARRCATPGSSALVARRRRLRAGRSSASASACRCSTRAARSRPAWPASACCPATVRLLPDGVKRPQMQWNRLDVPPPVAAARRASATRRGCTSSTPTFAADGPRRPWPRATTAVRVIAAVERGNVVATPVPPREVRAPTASACWPTSSAAAAR